MVQSTSTPPDAWTKAREALLHEADLTPEEVAWLQTTTKEDLLRDVQGKSDEYVDKSWPRKVLKAVEPFINGLERIGPALDTFANGDPHGLCILAQVLSQRAYCKS